MNSSLYICVQAFVVYRRHRTHEQFSLYLRTGLCAYRPLWYTDVTEPMNSSLYICVQAIVVYRRHRTPFTPQSVNRINKPTHQNPANNKPTTSNATSKEPSKYQL